MRRLITALAASAIVLMLAVVPVAAHNNTVSLECQGGASVNLTDYDTAHDNSVVITLDGVEVANKSDFGASFAFQSGALDPFKGHTLHVVVAAWDDPTGSQGFSIDVTKEIGPCKEPTPPPPPKTGSLDITKDVQGGPEGFSGDFKVSVDCGEAGTFTKTISFPDPGKVTIDDIDAGASCKVTETDGPTPPAGFTWGAPTYTGNPATIGADQTATVGVVNHLNRIPHDPSLLIDKTNDAPSVGGLPTVKEGDTVAFTLAYTFTGQEVANGVIKDVLPNGLTYVTGSATNSSEFTFDGYDAGTRTLTWLADTVSESGSVSYKATVDSGAADLKQPLQNVATIDSDGTPPDTGTSHVFVGPPVQAETSVPTAPRSDIGSGPETTTSGGSMLLILLGLAAIALAVVFVTPTPAAIRKRKDS